MNESAAPDIMDSDPCRWTVEDVQTFFRHHAPGMLSDMPLHKLPPLDPFLNILQNENIAGADLLHSVGEKFLEEQCGMNVIRMRTPILHCIKKLNRLHEKCTPNVRDPFINTPVSHVSPITLPAEKRLPTPTPMYRSESDQPRSSEIHVQDNEGRKRRKVVVIETVPLKASEKRPVQACNGYMPDEKTEIDELFFGKFKTGARVSSHPLPSHVNVESGPDEDDNFDFVNQNSIPAKADFAFRRMRHFMLHRNQIGLQRRGREAAAILPYPAGIKKPRSALVVQFDNQQKCVAIRECAIDSNAGVELCTDQPEDLEGEWSFLLDKYGGANDHVLPPLGQSTTSDPNASEMVSIPAEESGDDDRMAEEEAEPAGLPKDEVERYVDEAIASFIAKWSETRLPKLERTQAWKVWKRAKGSRIGRCGLIDTAKSEISRLERRLSIELGQVHLAKFYDKAEVMFTCGVLQPTVEDIEEQKWSISVVHRKTEPEHHVRRKTLPSHNGTPSIRIGNGAGVQTSLDVEDRLNLTPATSVNKQNDVENGRSDAMMSTPLGTPPPVDLDDFIVDDEANEADISQPPSPNVLGSTADTPIPGEENETAAEGLDRAMSESNQSMNLESSQRLTFNDPPGQLAEPEQASPAETAVSLSEADLPPASSFVAKRVKPEEGILATPPKTSNVQVIELSSDSLDASRNESRKKGRSPGSIARFFQKRKSHDSAMQLNLVDLTAPDIEALDISRLVEDADRSRLLIKLLYDAGREFREDLHECRLMPAARFANRIQAALFSLLEGHDQVEDLNDHNSEVMRKCAHMYYTWFNCEHLEASAFSLSHAKLTEVSQNEDQLLIFSIQLLDFLRMKDSRMFRKPGLTIPPKSFVLSSDEENNAKRATTTGEPSRKKRRKKVQMSQAAIESRQAAHDRQERFKSAVGSQSDATQLAEMIAGDSGHVELEINPVRGDDQPPILINPRVARSLKPHQIDGMRFMWRELTAETDEGVQGCLLAHAMGLGKTLQSIATMLTISETSQSDDVGIRTQLPKRLRRKAVRSGERRLRMLVLCPPHVIINWGREINRWVPNETLGTIYAIDGQTMEQRLRTLEEWKKSGGVLLLGYQMYRMLGDGKDSKTKFLNENAGAFEELLTKGPELVVADEAHHFKNQKSALGRAVAKLQTHSRIALTGTPLSNDIDEIYALISWVAPGYLGEKDEFNSRYAKPIKEGTYNESSLYEVRRSMKKLTVLRSEIEPKYHREDVTVLKGSLRPKVEFVLTVSLTDIQLGAYQRFVAALTGDNRNRDASQLTIFAWLNALTLLTNHPRAFRQKLLTKPKPKKAKQDQRELTPISAKSGDCDETGDAQVMQDDTAQDEVTIPEKIDDEDLYSHGFTKELIDYVIGDIDDNLDAALSAKTAMFLNLIQHAFDVGDKVLVFSSTIPTLDYLADLLKSINVKYGRIDGNTSMQDRSSSIERFEKDHFPLMLISTRAGGVGLNMQCANRVIIFDSGFNPTHEEQAIGRAYRIGQTKPVFVYRFLAGGTFEVNIENKQLFKSSLAQRVVDKKNPLRNALRNVREWLYEPREVIQRDIRKWFDKDPLVLAKMIARQYNEQEPPVMLKIHDIRTMETLQEDAKDPPLDDEERREVDEEIHLSRSTRKGRRGGPSGQGIPASTAPLVQAATASVSAQPNHNSQGTASEASGAANYLNGSGGLPPNHQVDQLAADVRDSPWFQSVNSENK